MDIAQSRLARRLAGSVKNSRTPHAVGVGEESGAVYDRGNKPARRSVLQYAQMLPHYQKDCPNCCRAGKADWT
jgi:hypothetical protein